MKDDIKVYDSSTVAAQLGMTRNTLLRWLSNNPDYYPSQRFNKDDLLWTVEDIEKVKQERARPGKGRRRR